MYGLESEWIGKCVDWLVCGLASVALRDGNCLGADNFMKETILVILL